MTQNTPPMEWYPDPADPSRERYWDGAQWTHNTRPVRTAAAGSADPWTAHDAGAQRQAVPTASPWGPADQAGHPAPAAARPAPATGMRPSGWWRRAIAGLVDTLLVTLLTALLGWRWVHPVVTGFGRLWDDMLADARVGRTTPATPSMLEPYGVTSGMLNAVSMVGVAVMLAYLVLSWGLAGRTLGQALTGIRVVPAATDDARVPAADGPRRPGMVRALVRALAWTAMLNLPYLMPLALASIVMPLFHPRRQGLHDLLARTQVVRSR